MGHDQRRAASLDSISEYFCHPNVRGIQASHIDGLEADHTVSRVEKQHSEVLLREVRHLGHQQLRDVGWRAHGGVLLWRRQKHPAAQFQRRLELRRLGWAQSLLRHQFRETGPSQARQPPET